MGLGLTHFGLFICGISIGLHGPKIPAFWLGIFGLMLIASEVP